MADLSPWRRQIDEALAHGWDGHTFEDLERAVDEGDMQAWCSPGTIVLTQIIQYPQQKRLFFFLVSGDLATAEAMSEDIYEFGRSHGCTVAAFSGRPGWQRTFLTRQGWSVKPFITMEKAL
jgi:hypothetical protein